MTKTKSRAGLPENTKRVVPATNEQGSGCTEGARRTGRIGRAEILGKYWELANLDPEVTKGTITGQLKALDSLCEELALDESGNGETAGEPKQQIYRSAWLREAAGKEVQAAPASPARPPAAGLKRASVTSGSKKTDRNSDRPAEA